MRDRSTRLSKLLESRASRESYIRSKLNVIVPSQIRALRLRRELKQEELGREADMKQSRISAMEQPGETGFNIETLVRLAAALKVGLKVEFVPFSELLRWENEFSQDSFNVPRIDDDVAFIAPDVAEQSEAATPREAAQGLAMAAAGSTLKRSYQEPDVPIRFQPSPVILDALQTGVSANANNSHPAR